MRDDHDEYPPLTKDSRRYHDSKKSGHKHAGYSSNSGNRHHQITESSQPSSQHSRSQKTRTIRTNGEGDQGSHRRHAASGQKSYHGSSHSSKKNIEIQEPESESESSSSGEDEPSEEEDEEAQEIQHSSKRARQMQQE